MGAVLSPILATIVGDVVKEFHISFNQAALLQGYPLLTSGCAALITQVWSRILGKRSAYVISTVILFATTVWNAKVTSFNEFLACRTVEGLGNGAYESIVISSVGDLYFVGPVAVFSIFTGLTISRSTSEASAWSCTTWSLSESLRLAQSLVDTSPTNTAGVSNL